MKIIVGEDAQASIDVVRAAAGGDFGCYVDLEVFRGTAEVPITACRFGKGATEQLTRFPTWTEYEGRRWGPFLT